MNAISPLSDTGNERIAMGGNAPPAIDAFASHVEDLRLEAGVWLDGKAVENAAEAEGLNTLLDLARKTAKDADAARAEEKKPHLDAAKEVDGRWKPIIDAANRIVDCCKVTLTPWNVAEQRRKDAEAAAARAAAEAEAEARRIAAAEALEANAGSIEAREQLDQVEASLKAAEKIARKAEKEAAGTSRLRTTYRPEVTDLSAAIKHYWTADKEAFSALVLELATRDVRAGKRAIPGITIHEEQKAF